MAGRKVGGGKSMLGGNPDQAQAYILQHFRKFLVNFLVVWKKNNKSKVGVIWQIEEDK